MFLIKEIQVQNSSKNRQKFVLKLSLKKPEKLIFQAFYFCSSFFLIYVAGTDSNQIDQIIMSLQNS
ncbi:hypothetical protein BXU01_14335 [[Flexibacter] sp. ATCC 35103]|nr:hypothetical protein BXU01_14335 [[Flexibacter] sp. ATCC 35103]